MNRTPIYEEHLKLGAKMVSFAGWDMPVEYPLGIKAEHRAVREVAGIFDVSHMGEIRVKGAEALKAVEWLTTNFVAQLKPGEAQYTLLANKAGGLVDDLIVYRLGQDDFLLCVNAANKDKAFAWCLENNPHKAEITDESSCWGQLALQGPQAPRFLEEAFNFKKSLGMDTFKVALEEYSGQQVIVATTGYTGELGCELFAPWDLTLEIWNRLLAVGQPHGLQPIGLGARNTLRLEMGYSLYGNEVSESCNPYESGLGWVIKPGKKEFLGREALLEKKAGATRKMVGLKLLDRGIARQGYSVFDSSDAEIGEVTSGAPSPTLGDNIALALLDKASSQLGCEIFVQVRARKLKAKVVEVPFVRTPRSD